MQVGRQGIALLHSARRPFRPMHDVHLARVVWMTAMLGFVLCCDRLGRVLVAFLDVKDRLEGRMIADQALR